MKRYSNLKAIKVNGKIALVLALSITPFTQVKNAHAVVKGFIKTILTTTSSSLQTPRTDSLAKNASKTYDPNKVNYTPHPSNTNGLIKQRAGNLIVRTDLSPLDDFIKKNYPKPLKHISTEDLQDLKGNVIGKNIFLNSSEPENKPIKIGFINKDGLFIQNSNFKNVGDPAKEELSTLINSMSYPPKDPKLLKREIDRRRTGGRFPRKDPSKHTLISEGVFDSDGNGVESIVKLRRERKVYNRNGESNVELIDETLVGKVDQNGIFTGTKEGVKLLNKTDLETLQKHTNTSLEDEITKLFNPNFVPSDSQLKAKKQSTPIQNDDSFGSKYHPAIHGDDLDVFKGDPRNPSPKNDAFRVGKTSHGELEKDKIGLLFLGKEQEPLDNFHYKIVEYDGKNIIVITSRKIVLSAPPDPDAGSLMLLEALKKHVENQNQQAKASSSASTSDEPPSFKPAPPPKKH